MDQLSLPLPSDRLAHLQAHLSPRYRPFLPHLALPLALIDVADSMGAGITPRMVDTAWRGICRELLNIEAPNPARHAASRLAVLRMATGLDACAVCGLAPDAELEPAVAWSLALTVDSNGRVRALRRIDHPMPAKVAARVMPLADRELDELHNAARDFEDESGGVR